LQQCVDECLSRPSAGLCPGVSSSALSCGTGACGLGHENSPFTVHILYGERQFVLFSLELDLADRLVYDEGVRLGAKLADLTATNIYGAYLIYRIS
jgi:hypothetical protein